MFRRVMTLLVVMIVLASHASADEPPLTLVQTIPLEGVEGRIDHMCTDSDGKRLYVAALGNNTMEVIDLVAGKRVQSVGGLSKPAGIRVLPGSGNIVVASGEDGKLRVYSPGLKLLGTVDGLDDADNVRVDPQGRLAYVGYGNGAIAIIDPGQFRKIGEVRLEGHPEAFQLERNGARIFANVPSARQVAVIDREKKSIIDTWPIRAAESNFPMALDEANRRLFVACRKPAKVIVLDTVTGKSVASVACCDDADDMFYDESTRQLLVTGRGGAISVISRTSAGNYELRANVPTATGARTSTFISASSRLCVAVPHRDEQRAELRIFRTAR